MSHFPLDRKRAAVAVFRHAKRLKTEQGAKWLSPMKLAQTAAGGGHHSQIYRWLSLDLSEQAEENHQDRRGAPPLLNENQISLLVGFACFQRTSLKVLSGNTIQQFCTSHLGVTPSPATISRIMNEHGFSTQKSLTRNSRMVSELVVEAALDATMELRSYEFPPHRLLFMDETGVWSNVTAPRTYHFTHWYDAQHSFSFCPFGIGYDFCRATFYFHFSSPSAFLSSPWTIFPIVEVNLRNNPVVEEKGDRFRDTVALTVRGDGVDIPPFFIAHIYKTASRVSGRRCEVGEEPVKGINIPLMKSYIDHISQYVEEQSLLVMDRLSSHTSAKIRRYIESFTLPSGERKFYILLLPAKTAFLISPLDMGAISAFKSYFHRLDRTTLNHKRTAVQEAWDQVTNESLVNICRNCGVIEKESIDSLRSRFLKDVVGLVPEEYANHLDYYDAWSSGHINVEGATLGRGVSLELPLQLEEGHLDGRRWSNYGI